MIRLGLSWRDITHQALAVRHVPQEGNVLNGAADQR